jgi:hypothetical protein
MKLTKGKLSKLLNKKKQSLKRYKTKGSRGHKRRTFRKKNAIYDLSRKTLRQRGGGEPNPLDNVSFSEVLQYIGKHLNGKGEVGEEVQDPDQGLEGAAEDQQNAADKEKAEAEAKKKAEEEGLPQGEVEGEVEGEGEGEGGDKGGDKGEDGLASQTQEPAPEGEKKEGEGEEQLDYGTNSQSLVTSEGEEKKDDDLQKPAVLASEQVVADEQQTGEEQGNLATANEEVQGNLGTANEEVVVADNPELSTATVEPELATVSAPVVKTEEELKKEEEQ